MADEIKIHLSTYLKDSGIKATKSQVDRLSRDIQKMNREAQASTQQAEAALGRLPGAFGKAQRAASGAFGSLLAIVGALKLGIDIGNWIQEKAIRPLLGLKHPIEELKQKNAEVERSWKAATDAFNASMEKWSAGWAKVTDGADRARQGIEDVTQAYLKMQAARERGAAASTDATMIGMERDKFNAMAGASSPEEAAALGKYHDILIAEAKTKADLAKFDRAAEASAVREARAVKELHAVERKRAALKGQMAEMEGKLSAMQSQGSVGKYGFAGSGKLEERLLKDRDALQAKMDAVERDIARRESDISAMRVARAAEPQERQNLVERAKLEVDERKKAYDDYVAHVEAEELKRAEEEWRREEEEIRRAAELELRERQRLERELAAQRLQDLRSELAERQRAEGEARSRQSAAESALAQAWGWYRDKARMQSVIDERKAQAAAEVQWQKDFERLKSWRSDWRTAEFGSLSAADEAVRQVALAKEEKAAADRAVIETAENTRNLAEKVDELLAMKG
ncbi:MAG: hypothetical protein J6V72_11055 [Kiritimatiellae bacterium]|nr:hypothetical protein [Kiritimatiellia bacterium]